MTNEHTNGIQRMVGTIKRVWNELDRGQRRLFILDPERIGRRPR